MIVEVRGRKSEVSSNIKWNRERLGRSHERMRIVDCGFENGEWESAAATLTGESLLGFQMGDWRWQMDRAERRVRWTSDPWHGAVRS
jgi:hypothetical protein